MENKNLLLNCVKTTHNFLKMYKLLVETKRGNLGTSAVSTCIFRPLKIYYPQQQAVSGSYSYFNSQDNISSFKNPALSIILCYMFPYSLKTVLQNHVNLFYNVEQENTIQASINTKVIFN